MKAEEILHLFELIKNAPEENWGYNRSRLLEILCDFEKRSSEGILLEGNYTSVSEVAEKVIDTLQIIHKSYSLDEILYSPLVQKKFEERLNSELKEIQGCHV